MLIEILLFASCVLKASAYCWPAYDTFQWSAEWMPEREDLYCSTLCKTDEKPCYKNYCHYNSVDECCTCMSCTVWEGKEVNLPLEYVTVQGQTIVLPDQNFTSSTYYKIENKDGQMAEIPSKLCSSNESGSLSELYPQRMTFMTNFREWVVKMDFSENKITHISDLTCLEKLDTLILANNRISYVTNTSFSTLRRLRLLDLSNNMIQAMDAGVLFHPDMFVFRAYFHHNDISELDLSNGILKTPFCVVDYGFNRIENVVNSLGVTVSEDEPLGPGYFSIDNNIMKKFPDLKNLLNLDNLAEVGHLLSFGFDLRGIQLNCDCSLASFIGIVEEYRDIIWREYYNVTCVSPPELKGKIAYLVDPIKFVCKVDVADGCPTGCTCIDQPDIDTLHVDCSSAGLKEFPNFLPSPVISRQVSLNLSNNLITKIPNVPYLRNVFELDVSNNLLESISDEVATELVNATLNISRNAHLRSLPQTFQFRHLCSIKAEQVVIDCDCENVWIKSWVRTKHCYSHRHEEFRCYVSDVGVISANEFDGNLLNCDVDQSVYSTIALAIAVVVLALILGGIVFFTFRYELLVLAIRWRQKTSPEIYKMYKFDVLISFNEKDIRCRKWVNDKLLPFLTSCGHRVFVPYRDVPFGSERDSEIARTIGQTRCFLLVLSERYLYQPKDADDIPTGRCWTENEWKYGWNQYKTDTHKNIVIVNYDHISSFEVKHKQIKAYMRVGHCVEFGNHDIGVLGEIKKKLGSSALLTPRDVADFNYNKQLLARQMLPQIGIPEQNACPLPTWKDVSALKEQLHPNATLPAIKYKKEHFDDRYSDNKESIPSEPTICPDDDFSLYKSESRTSHHDTWEDDITERKGLSLATGKHRRGKVSPVSKTPTKTSETLLDTVKTIYVDPISEERN